MWWYNVASTKQSYIVSLFYNKTFITTLILQYSYIWCWNALSLLLVYAVACGEIAFQYHTPYTRDKNTPHPLQTFITSLFLQYSYIWCFNVLALRLVWNIENNVLPNSNRGLHISIPCLYVSVVMSIVLTTLIKCTYKYTILYCFLSAVSGY